MVMTTNHEDFNTDTHVFRSSTRSQAPRVVTIEEKMKLASAIIGDYLFYPLPADEEWVRREGWDMSHCLAVCQTDYCRRMKRGEIEVYSMTHIPTNTPVVDIEVALTRSSYGGPVSVPTVSQVRGVANQCPPRDDYLPSLISFKESFGVLWKWMSHSVKNFDDRNDGDLMMRRWAQLEGGMQKTGAQDSQDNDK
jgi:hypothetical protein